jgi:hypothetical protein
MFVGYLSSLELVQGDHVSAIKMVEPTLSMIGIDDPLCRHLPRRASRYGAGGRNGARGGVGDGRSFPDNPRTVLRCQIVPILSITIGRQ